MIAGVVSPALVAMPRRSEAEVFCEREILAFADRLYGTALIEGNSI